MQTYKYPEGDIYEGDWSKEGKKHGIGKISFTDGTVYEGRFVNGFFAGYGSLRLPDNTVYAGLLNEINRLYIHDDATFQVSKYLKRRNFGEK